MLELELLAKEIFTLVMIFSVGSDVRNMAPVETAATPTAAAAVTACSIKEKHVHSIGKSKPCEICCECCP